MGSAVGESHLLHFVDLGVRLKGVVHVGANHGQEVEWYLSVGAKPILCFEPHPAALRRALDRWSSHPDVAFVGTALGRADGTLEMWAPADDEKTSRYLPIPTPGHDWTNDVAGERITAPLARFDTWAKANWFEPSQYNALSVDVQGMEMEVLEGFGDLLAGFSYLCIELSREPMYRGEPPAGQVIDYLAHHGFVRDSEVEAHNDVVFYRDDR